MRDQTALGPWVERFLCEHVVTERNLSRNTQKSYRDTFALLLAFITGTRPKSVDRLAVRDITSERVLQFLNHLEDERGCSVQTRNQRLAAISAFARFVGSRDPAHLGWCTHIRAIPAKKATVRPIGWLSKAEMDAMLEVSDRTTLRGREEHALLLFLYNTGARVSEATSLTVGDLQIGRNGAHALSTLHGKGGRERQCPLWPRTERALAELIVGRQPRAPVFLSRHRKPFTRFGVYRLVERCAAAVPMLSGRKVTPHVLRHTCACHLLQAGVDINTVRAWLGHASIDTTNVYAEIDVKLKAKAVALCDAAQEDDRRPWKEQEGLMAFLKAL